MLALAPVDDIVDAPHDLITVALVTRQALKLVLRLPLECVLVKAVVRPSVSPSSVPRTPRALFCLPLLLYLLEPLGKRQVKDLMKVSA